MGILCMKTKIIYISGNELFDMADIRAAFDEVRAALSLGSDTVLFGVPVDKDDALMAPKTEENTVIEPVVKPIIEPIVDDKTEQVEPVHQDIEQPKLKRSRTRAKVVPITESEPVPESEPKQKATVVPILSVLGSNANDEKDDKPAEEDTIIDDIKIEITQPIADTPVDETEDSEYDINQVTVTDTTTTSTPAEPEKTLEELLESMTPLGEDTEQNPEPIVETKTEKLDTPIEEKNSDDDIDITLEKLATEFVENQDKINTPQKTSSRSKIGKLKNILPFKKAKHDDSGLMGDLFGWAGVASNDEDFTIPGFFTNAAAKK